jgi:hypothetical protein
MSTNNNLTNNLTNNPTNNLTNNPTNNLTNNVFCRWYRSIDLAHIPLFLYPFLNTVSKTRPFEYLRLTSLGVIGALVKVWIRVSATENELLLSESAYHDDAPDRWTIRK